MLNRWHDAVKCATALALCGFYEIAVSVPPSVPGPYPSICQHGATNQVPVRSSGSCSFVFHGIWPSRACGRVTCTFRTIARRSKPLCEINIAFGPVFVAYRFPRDLNEKVFTFSRHRAVVSVVQDALASPVTRRELYPLCSNFRSTRTGP